jgi:hypothetical protein
MKDLLKRPRQLEYADRLSHGRRESRRVLSSKILRAISKIKYDL